MPNGKFDLLDLVRESIEMTMSVKQSGIIGISLDHGFIISTNFDLFTKEILKYEKKNIDLAKKI